MEQSHIYLDHAATTPCDPEVVRAMEPYWNGTFGNPSSSHWFGQEAVRAVDNAREAIARFLGASALEVFFTGSATESDNLAVMGAVEGARASWPEAFRNVVPHVVVSFIEHEAVLEPCRSLEAAGLAEVSYAPVDGNGLVSVDEVMGLVRPSTVLVSIMYANSEIGTIQPVAEIGARIKAENERRAKEYQKARSQGARGGEQMLTVPVRFHTDAVQAAQFLNCNVNELNADLLTLSAHKIYGPKGIGLLYVRRGTPLRPLLLGGGQERGLRSGTENVPYAVGFAKAIELVEKNRTNTSAQIQALRDHLIDRITNEIPGAALNGDRERRLPNNANIRFPRRDGEVLLVTLDQKGIAVSTGSACASRGLKPSHVLAAIGIDTKRNGSLRFTLGKHTTKAEIDAVVDALVK